MNGEFTFDTRRGGCDIRPTPPKPDAVQGGDIEYLPDQAAPDRAECSIDGGRIDGDRVSIGVLSFFGWAICAVVLLWMISAASPALSSALALHGWRFWASLALGFLPTAAVACIIAYAVAVFGRMPKVRQLDERMFPDKTELRRRLKRDYLSKFPDFGRYARENGFAPGDEANAASEVVACLGRLSEKGAIAYSDSRGWLADFRYLQKMQDERAEEIITRTWKLVAVKTAVSPWKVVDMAAVVYNSTIMVTRLARLYNRRASSRAAFRLVCSWLTNIYIAGEMGDASQGAVEWASANDLITATYKPLAHVFGKVAEGGVNAFLVYRLGRRAVAAFRPLV